MILLNKKQIAITSLVTLSPIAFGLYYWNKLPNQMATHFSNNQPNGWSSKPFAVIGIPLILLFLHWVCIIFTLADPKRKNISPKIFSIVLWIIPICSLVVFFFIYSYSMGISFQSDMFQNFILGFLLLVLGNYFPKCRQNYTIGVKLPWTLANEENWNLTHRMAGKTYVFAGILTIICGILQIPHIIFIFIILATAIPVCYSFYLHVKKGY